MLLNLICFLLVIATVTASFSGGWSKVDVNDAATQAATYFAIQQRFPDLKPDIKFKVIEASHQVLFYIIHQFLYIFCSHFSLS